MKFDLEGVTSITYVHVIFAITVAYVALYLLFNNVHSVLCIIMYAMGNAIRAIHSI